MSAIHRIESNALICDGDTSAECHQYPDRELCDHAEWPCFHRNISHDVCWAVEYAVAVTLSDCMPDDAPTTDDDGTYPDQVVEIDWCDGLMLHPAPEPEGSGR